MTPSLARRLSIWLTLLLAVVIGVLTLVNLPLPASPPGNDKLHHFLAFAGLVFPVALLWPRALGRVVPVAIAYGGLIELIQPFVGRSAEWADFGMDVLGVGVGTLLGWALHRLWTARVARRI